MSVKKKYIYIIFFVIIILIIGSALFIDIIDTKTQNQSNIAPSRDATNGGNELGMTPSTILPPTTDSGFTKQDPTKIIKKSNVSLQTDNYTKSLDSINKLINDTNSMVVKKQENQGDTYYITKTEKKNLRSVDIIVKVEKDKFDDFNNEIKKYANVVSYYEEAIDISSTYSDIEARINSYKLQEQQLNELLKKATVAKDLLEISNQIQSIISQRESLERQKASYDNQIEYSTVTIKLSEVKSTEITEKSVFDRVKDTFKLSLEQMKNMGVNIVMIIVYIIPYIALLALLIIIVYVVIKLGKKKKNK